jgi:hypothetical protein
MENKFIAAVRKGNDALVFELGPMMPKNIIEKALQIAGVMNIDDELDEIVDFLERLLED